MRVLVVDDEQVHLDSICRGLRLAGHRGIGVTNIDDARAQLEAPDAAIDLVLTDLTMPGGSGHDLIAWLVENRPQLPVIVVTGITSNEGVNAVRERGIPVLLKPFTPAELDAAIKALME